jgi:hypothetical protein
MTLLAKDPGTWGAGQLVSGQLVSGQWGELAFHFLCGIACELRGCFAIGLAPNGVEVL